MGASKMRRVVTVCTAILVVFTNSATSKRPSQLNTTDVCPNFWQNDCTVFSPIANVVTASIFRNTIAKGKWIGLYRSEVNVDTMYGKAIFKWIKTGDVFKQFIRTVDIATPGLVQIDGDMILTEDECGAELSKGLHTAYRSRFFSQEPTEYVWLKCCWTRSCDSSIIGVLIRDTRKAGKTEFDLGQLPWHKMSADLMQVCGVTMDDPRFQYEGVEPGEEFLHLP